MPDVSAKPVIFISYSHKDEPDHPRDGEIQWLSYVQSYLAPASLNGTVQIWADQGIPSGDKWQKEIEARLESCDVFVLLISINSLASDFVVNFEIKTIQARQARGDDVHIFPIVLEPFPKNAAPWLMELNLRPQGGRPLSEFQRAERNREMARIADEIGEIVRTISLRNSSELSEAVNPQRPRGGHANDPPFDQRTFAPDFAADRVDRGIDALDIGPDVEAFAQLICLESARPPLSIALFGSWGSGKTFFMERLLERVDGLTEISRRADSSEESPSPHRIIANVVQIRFNAWHYSDANLWASLTAEFFDQLRAGGAGKKSTATYENLVDRVARHVRSLEVDALSKTDEATGLEWQLQSAEDAASAVRVHLDTADEKALAEAAGKALSNSFEKHRETLKELGRRVYMDDLANDIKVFAAAAREVATVRGKLKLVLRVLTSGTPASWFALIGLVLLLAFLAAIPFADVTDLAVKIGQFQQWSWVPTCAAFVAAIWKGYLLVKPVLDGASAFSKSITETKGRLGAELVVREAEIAALKRRRETAREEVVAARGNLERYGGSGSIRAPEAALRYLLHDAAEGASFEEGLGIVSRARRSFEKLDEIIRRARNERRKDQRGIADGRGAVRSSFSSVAVPDRIILYIDDLDRCTHKQVYEVLQAVHLLLALESFVVIVGVDIRWIDGAIAHHFEADLSRPANSYLSEEKPNEIEAQGSHGKESSAIRRSRSLEYLEKIFQIPFWLRAIDSAQDGTYSKLIKLLVEDNLPVDDDNLPPRPEAIHGEIPTTGLEPEVSSVDAPEIEAPTGALRETLERVTLIPEEYALLRSSEIGSLVGKSPRAVKRFVNIYRIIRARRRGVELARFVGTNGRPPLFPAAMLLLAIDVGQMSESTRSFRNVISTGSTQTFDEAVDMSLTMSDDPEHWFAEETGIDGLDAAIKLMRSQNAGKLSIAEWTELADEIRRYSFNDPRA